MKAIEFADILSFSSQFNFVFNDLRTVPKISLAFKDTAFIRKIKHFDKTLFYHILTEI